MAKHPVEQAPKLDFTSQNFHEIFAYLSHYGIADEQGRYLHWNQLKWRVPGKNARNIWLAVKFHRYNARKTIDLHDKADNEFHYCIHDSLEPKLHKIVQLGAGKIAAIAGTQASENVKQNYLVSSLLMEEAITSAQLEGAATTRADAKKMLEEELTPATPDERMILNNYMLLRLADRRKNEPLTRDLMLEFHRVATHGVSENDNIPGEFRCSNDIYIGNDDNPLFYPPDYQLLEDRLEKICSFANDKHDGEKGSKFIPPVIKAIILHFLMGYEHAFRDGNGRTARAIFYWFMLKNGYDIFEYISISKVIKEHARDYGLSYLYVQKDYGDLTYFIDFHLKVILEAFEELQEHLRIKTEEFHELISTLENSKYKDKLNFIQKDLIKKGVKEPGRLFKVKAVQNVYGVSENTARKLLRELANMNIFLPITFGRSTYFISPADLRERLGIK
ncbi:filamentation induced by cAMP protein Fic [Dickeya chrysanthemi Ech1591]|uniref:Filamentation induced by cAMP protein Fic n=1 Tax=Dickeya chrysanthemi (strain Ech1591) TaxID=561229 RepID=C6CKW1_DICC1|nr:Fic family protein [Dickeya chrysanthemi]ACT05611.1 filamentation induced by cAMP protein Fic [Dickeya chrysanthemi Ech1591]WJM85091.1 Fic family protein [Dickeya chrysanthemi]